VRDLGLTEITTKDIHQKFPAAKNKNAADSSAASGV
jgi:hypothetical protein